MRHRGDIVEIVALARGVAPEAGGYLWRGELRVFDNEALIGWYAADEGAVRSKGSLYYSLHAHGHTAAGRWVGLSFDGPAVTGLATLARTEDEALALMTELQKGETPVTEPNTECVEVVVTAEAAEWLAVWTRQLVEDGIVACGHNITPIRVTYRWDGKIWDHGSARVALHTRASLVPEIVARADRDHADEVPCVIATPLVSGHPEYLKWIVAETRDPGA